MGAPASDRRVSDPGAILGSMIPEFDVDIETNVVLERLRPPTSVSCAGSAGFNGDHFDLTHTSWEEAHEALTEETRWLNEADLASTTTDEFDDHLYDAEQDDPETRFVTMVGLDVGVAGLVLALSAAGYLPWISCSAHGGGTKIPQVGLYASAPRTRILLDLARTADCGVEDQDGGLWIFGRSVYNLNKLAHLLLAARDRFADISPEAWDPSNDPQSCYDHHQRSFDGE